MDLRGGAALCLLFVAWVLVDHFVLPSADADVGDLVNETTDGWEPAWAAIERSRERNDYDELTVTTAEEMLAYLRGLDGHPGLRWDEGRAYWVAAVEVWRHIVAAERQWLDGDHDWAAYAVAAAAEDAAWVQLDAAESEIVYRFDGWPEGRNRGTLLLWVLIPVAVALAFLARWATERRRYSRDQ